MIGDEMGERVVSVGLRFSGKLTAAALYQIVKLVHSGAHQAVGHNKVSFAKLNKGAPQLTGVEVNKSEIEGFDKYAKRYKFEYSLVREKNDPDKYNFMFRAADMAKLDAAARDFFKDNTKEHGSLKEKLEEAREQAYQVNKARSRDRSANKDKARQRGRDGKER